jgi:serine/threonine-protein kinase
MTLEDWLKQERTLADQLKVIEGLCSALNEGHQRGSVHRSLEPAKIEVASDGACDLKAAIPASAGGSAYRAPELGEGASASPQSDIYSAGVIFYEMLSGRNPNTDRPTPLADLRPDVPRDLTDAVMGCLERGPDWRPKDLSYLLQVVRTLRGQGAGKSVRSPTRAPEASKPSAAPRAAAAPRRGGKTGSTSNLPLFIAATLLLAGAAAGGWLWFQSNQGPRMTAARPIPTTAAAAPVTTQAPEPAPSPSPSPMVGKPAPEPAGRAPATVASPATAAPTPRPTPTPPPLTLATRPTPEPTAAEPAPTPAAAVAPKGPAPEEMAAVAQPTVLTALSPPQVKRGATAIFDVRGIGLRGDQKAAILRIKEAPNGISVVKQKYVNPGLVQVIVKLDETAAPGSYGLAMADPAGTYTNTLSFTVAR